LAKIKVIALVEARVLSGPAKNILRFAVDCRETVNLTVVTFIRPSDNREASNNEFISTARSLAIPVEEVEEAGAFDLSVLAKLRQIFENNKPDIVQTHSVKSHFLLSLLHGRQFRWIAFHHGYTNENFKAAIYRQFDKWSLRSCDFITTVCREFADRMPRRQIQRGRVFVLPNSVKTDVVCQPKRSSEATRQELNIAQDKLVVLAIGRLSPEKGHRFLIDAISKVWSLAPQLKFEALIAGAGISERKLKEQVNEQGVGQNVRLLGHVSDVRPLFSIADLFVLPSLSEGSPNVLLESMAAFVPIVATRVGGVTELVEDGQSALLVPPANSDELCQSMIELLVNRPRAEQFARVAFDRARLLFSPAKYDERILDIYGKAIGL